MTKQTRQNAMLGETQEVSKPEDQIHRLLVQEDYKTAL